jgi:hypothetical protein
VTGQRDQSEQGPKCLSKPAEPAKMGHAEPTQGSVGIFVVGINKSGEGVNGLWKATTTAKNTSFVQSL